MTDSWQAAVGGIGLSNEQATRTTALFERASKAVADLRASNAAKHRANAVPLAHWVPGRVEFLGKHTDYAGGRSLLCTVERGVCIVALPRNDALLRIRAASTGETVECMLDATAPTPPAVHWATYAATVARRLARNFGDSLRGADVAFLSDLPVAAGLSSSSALVVAISITLLAANGIAGSEPYRRNIRTIEDLAEYLGCIENGFDFRELKGDAGVGTLSGCEDQTAMLCARPGALTQYSFCPVRFERAVPLPPGLVFGIASSGLRAEKTAGALPKYNLLARKARALAVVWQRGTGRADSTIAGALSSHPDAGDELRHRLQSMTADGFSTQELTERLEQFIVESEIVIPAAADALERGDLERLGGLVERSVDGAVRLLRNQVPETITLTQLARDLGAVAASPFGAGFGGSVWALIKEEGGGDGVSRFVERWRSAYVARFPEHAATSEFFLSRAGPPSARISGLDAS